MPTIAESVSFLRDSGEFVLKIPFGGGFNSAVNPARIDITECADGENFDITLDGDTFRPRPPFDLEGTTPNAKEVRGIISLQKANGQRSVLIQAEDTVYNWDGADTFTSVGSCHPNSRLRGGKYSTSTLDDFVIITDLEKKTVVKKWDGLTFVDFAHNLSFPEFFAKYCFISDERAFFFNVQSDIDVPHIILGSARGTTTSTSAVETLAVTDRPSSAVAENDPFFIPMPDLKPINGVVQALGIIAISTLNGQLWKLLGNTPTVAVTNDAFRIERLFLDAGAVGDESLISVGNDIFFGRQGLVDSLIGAEAFGDVEPDDPSRFINKEIENVAGWAASIYDTRKKKAYFWPDDGNEVWVFSQSIYEPLKKRESSGTPISPWSKYTTALGDADFRQSSVALVERISDGQEFVYFGGAAGKFYSFDGDGVQDSGSATVTAKRTTGLIELPRGAAYDVKGHVTYTKKAAGSLTLTFKYGGDELVDETTTLTIPAPSGGSHFGGEVYFGGDFYFGAPFESRLEWQNYNVPGKGNFVQVEAELSSAAGETDIHEIQVSFKAS